MACFKVIRQAYTMCSKINMENKLMMKLMVLCGSHIAHIISIGMCLSIGVLYKEIRSEFQVSQSEASWTASIFNGVLGFVGIPMGIIVPRFGERLPVFVGTIILCAGMITSSIVPTYDLLYLTYGLIAGTGSGIIHYCAGMIPLSHFDSKWRPLATTLANSGTAVSALVMPPFMVACIDAYSWRTTFVVLGCMSAIGLLCAAMLIRPGERVFSLSITRTREPNNVSGVAGRAKGIDNINDLSLKQSITYVLHNSELMVFVTSTVLTFLVVYGPPTFLPDLMKESMIVDYQVAWCIMGMGVGNLCGRIISGVVASRFKNHVQLIHGFTLLGSAASTLIIAFANDLTTFMAMSILVGLFNGGYFSLILATIADYVTRDQAAVSYGILLTGTGISMTAGMPLAGFVSDYFRTERGAFIFSGCVMFLAAVVLCLVRTKRHCAHAESYNLTNTNGHLRETAHNFDKKRHFDSTHM